MDIKTVGDLQKALAELDPKTPAAVIVAKAVDHDDVRPFRSDSIAIEGDPTTPGGILLTGWLRGTPEGGDWNEVKL